MTSTFIMFVLIKLCSSFMVRIWINAGMDMGLPGNNIVPVKSMRLSKFVLPLWSECSNCALYLGSKCCSPALLPGISGSYLCTLPGISVAPLHVYLGSVCCSCALSAKDQSVAPQHFCLESEWSICAFCLGWKFCSPVILQRISVESVHCIESKCCTFA